MHRLFEDRVEEAPDDPAVSAGGVDLTYAELNAWANRLARHLRRLGIGPESVTALLLERSPELIVCALATFKAGGAYLPIDPAQPAERVDYIVKDSGAGVLVTTAPLLRRFQGLSAPGGVVLLEEIPDDEGGPLTVEVGPESLAYVIYTSGSTGAPKGAELCHGGLSSVVAWNRAYYGLGPGQRISMVASPGFDASLWEMWPALSAGSSLHLPPREVMMSPPDFLPWAAQEGITVSWLPAPLADAVLDEPIPAGLQLRSLQSGGDRLLRRPSPEAPFLMSNVYGPAEASIVSTVAHVPPQEQEEGLPHIGRPLTYVTTYLLGADLDRVIDGAEGELFLGGVGLGRGYRRRPALTAEKFVPDPFGPEAGQRLYRTGDLARRMASGNLEFLGRIDHQVKIRGTRVELGEIEVALLRHPEVREATVLAREGRLIGYVAERAAGLSDAEDLRGFLALSLPEVMIPAGWVFLDALPLTANGKVDRKALARIEPAELTDPETVAPRTPVEAAVAGIWGDVLKLGRVSVEDDFFALGGHSLLASRVASRVREALGADPGVRGIFDHPTVAALAAWVERQDRGGKAAAPLPGLQLAGLQIAGPAPLSFAQQRLWFVERLRPGTAAYNLAQTVDLRGGLSVSALGAAFAAVIGRHDALRTVFAPGPEGDPVQIVGSSWSGPPLPGIDFQGVPDGMRRDEAERICREQARRPYDLERGPLFRSILLALGAGEHRLFVGLHHIVSDAWSIGVLMSELAALYRGAELPPLAVQYPAYAVWQRRRFADDSVAPRVDWWRAHLEGAPDVLELPADRLRPATPSLRGERLRLDLGPEMEEALAAWSRERGATLFMTLLAAFQILVGRFTGQDDFVLGTPVAGRDRPELEAMIGFFVNLLPLRARVTAGTTFRGLVAAVRESVLGAFAHQDFPFDRLVEELAPVRDPSRAPLVQVVFAIQDAPAGPDLGALGAQVTAAAEVETGASELDFVLFMERGGPQGPGLAAIAEHATDLFDSGTVGRLLANFKTLLAGIVADPERRVDELPLLSAEERDQAVFGWNRTVVPLPSLSVDRLFEEQARRAPGALAVSASEVSWTYGELSSRAASLSRRLVRLGAGPETLVGLLLERSPELILAVVATLGSGASYLPVDPAWPAERVEQILRDAGVRTLLSTGSLLERFSGLSGLSVPIVLLDSIGGAPEPAETPLRRPAEPGGLAYVIYTSGSTGAPKGAELHHRGLSNLANWSVRRGGLGTGERVSMVAAPAFDASVWEIWPALSAGASLHPAPPEVVLRPSAFLPWAAGEGITVAFLPTPLAEAVLAEPVPSGLRLRLLHTGGDRLLRRPIVDLPFELSNAYGPTECTVVATAGLVSSHGDRPPHIGRPIDNVLAYVLDRGLGPVPPGAPGELCLGGAGVARGYRHRPDLTAERFVPDPFGAGGERLYRTGDLARRMPSGDLEMLGRIDHQVKIRGHRIELGEIEAALVRLAAVREATVVVQEPEHRLVACVVPAAGAERSGEPLRAALAGVLPQVMIPSAWVFLDALPLSPNGKVDRKALARWAPVSSSPAGLAPRTPLEAQMAAIWAELLGVPSVGVTDDLFALGGHSLLAARLVDRVRARLGVEMPLRTMFEAPTVATMAVWVEVELLRSRPERERALAIEPAGPGAALSFAQQRLWFLDRLEPGSAVYNIPVLLRLDGALEPGLLAAALAEVVRRHEALRTTFEVPPGAADPVQVIHPPVVRPLPVLDLEGLDSRDSEAARQVDAEGRRPFDLRRGPLLRTVLLRFGPDRHQLLINLHHIVADGVSVEVFERELAALYAAFAAGQPSPLPELPLQYPDFAVWQRHLLVGEELERQAAYWRVRLADPQATELPADRPRPAVRTSRGAVLEAELPAARSGALDRLGRGLGATPFMTLLAGFLTLLHRYTGQDDLLVGTPVSGRGRADLEGLIGFFVNTLPLRADLAGEPSFAEVVARVRASALAAYAHQDLPFERLVAEAAPERDLSRNPLFQVIFAYLESWGSLALGPGLTMAEAAGVHTGTAKFDLSFHVGRDARAGGGLRLWLEHSTDLFDGATIRRLIGGFERLLEGAVARPEAPVATLPLLSPAERAQLGALDRAEHRGHPTGLLHALFEAQAQRTPEAVALVADGAVLSYAELAARSALLARRLRALGAGPEVAVAVCLERRADLVVTLLAVLRSGSFYVPIDPRYPEERRAFLVADSGARIVVTENGIDSLEGPAGPAIEPLPENLAYLIYTSGSTGRPKAVAITHASAVRLAFWAREVYGPAELRGVLAGTAVTFDLSVFELFVTLAWGGAVILLEDALALLAGPPELPPGLEATLVNTVPSALAELLREGALPRSVRTVNLAGEALSRTLSDQVYARPETERLYNLYGPSEDTTYSTWALVAARSARPPSIGRPVHDSRAYVLDRWLERLPQGVPGELCLAGDGLARGYLGRPDLTAERFVPDPFSERLGERMYRTGDLAKLRFDGSAGELAGELEYLGRLDQQVKIRGYRIELGEVEAALSRLPGVAGAAVLVRADGPGGPRLVAYLAGAEDAVSDPRRALLQSLPEPMVPSEFVVLAELPLTPHGKVDRRALAKMAPAPKALGVGEPLRTPFEAAMAGVWSTLLGVEGIGAADDFFALGGHSLLATRLVALVRERLGVELPVRTVFQEPTVARLAAWIEAELLRGAAAVGPALDPALTSAPLSFAQQRLWFLDRLEPGSSAYNLPVLLELSGPLQPAALSAAVAEVVRRHAALRTTFEVPEGGADPLQTVHPPASWEFPAIDLSVLPAPRRAAEAARLSDAEAGRPFDLRHGPLLRTLMLRLGVQEHRVLAAMHHIVSDGWSIGVLVSELAALYGAFSTGRPSPLAELPAQYPDFAVWQRRWLSGGEMERQLAWWRGRLADPPVSELPFDRPRPAAWSYRGAVQRLVLPEDLTLRLERLGMGRGVTPFMMHLGAFFGLLGRYTGQDDLLVGAPVAGRSSPEVAGLIGFFVNTLALRGNLAGDPSSEELLARVRESALAAYAHQDFPFDNLVAELVPGRDLSRNPLFQVMLAFENFSSEPVEVGELAIRPGAVGGGTAKFDLTLGVRIAGGRTLFEAEHSTDLFDPTTIARFLQHLVRLLEGIAAAPERRVAELPLLTTGEAQQLREWNDTSVAFPTGLCLHELVEAQAARTPERPAVSFDGRSLTYRQLDLAANRLARRLRASGAMPESVVGVLAERSLDQMVGLLAVLKAGAGYLPLDPDYPAERLAWMIADSQVPVVLAEDRLAGGLPASVAGVAGARLVALDGAADAGGDASPLKPCADPENLAYVIYTSGSTGRPKGAMLPHRAIVSHLRWMQEALPLRSSDRVLQKTSFAFDASVWEIWAPLSAGALLVIARQGEESDPDALVRRVQEEGATVLQVVPSLLGALLEGGLEKCRTLRRVCCGGEALTPALAEGFRSRLDAELINLYGPTETAMEVVVWAYERDGRRGVVPLGRPVSNTRIHLVDRELRLVPAGVHGELLIGGAQVGRGYLGRPELTAERFVPDPFSGEAGARLYRAGDLARWLADGVLDFLGRLDRQVKLRGLRIELGEIEAALGRHPGVSQAVVLVREDRIGAWYVPVEPSAGVSLPSAAELVAALRAELPEYMVPAWFESLPALPLLPNGKVDRRTLEGRVPAAMPRAARVAPGTPIEAAVAEVWSELLGIEEVGVADDFFTLGGHSLMAARLAVWLRERLRVEMPLRVIFQEPTVARLAAWIEAELRQADAGAAPVLAAGLGGAASPLSFAQQRLWFLDQLQPGSHVYNMPLDLALSGPLCPSVLAQALAEVVRRHAALRTTFEVPAGASDPIQVVRPSAGWTLPRVDLSAFDAGRHHVEAERLAQAEIRRPFNLGRWPLLRTFLLRLKPNGHRLLGTLHHIVSDGLSMELLQRELGALCEAFAAGRPSPLPGLPVQYPDFAVWQRSWLSGGELERQLAWWRGRLATAPTAPVLELPADRPRPAVWSHRGGVESASLPADLADGLERLGRRHGATPFMTLLGAFFALLHRVTNQDELVVGAPVAGRSRPEVAGLIGLFVNTLALRVSLAGEPSFEELLARVRERALQSYAYQDLPFEKLVAELVPGRDLSRNPLVQVVFALHDAPEPVRGGEGLVLTAGEGAHSGTAKFDLSLHIGRTGGGMGVWAEYGTDLFDRATLLRLLGGFGNLLAGVFAQGETVRVRDLPLLSAPERAQVVREWSDTATTYSRAATIHGLFEEQARRFPDRVVLVGEEELTYAELDLRAERLAARLRSLGVRPDERVGLFAERSADLIAALLGILKAGGAYLPLDPQSPAERLAGMLADAEVRVLVVQEGLLPSLPNPPAPGTLRLPLGEVLSAGPATSARTSVDPNNLAYVMFTSGSTGRPKGVAVTHGNVVRLVRETDYARLDEECVVLQFAPVPFDASTFEIWGPLLNGGRLALFPAGPPDLRRLGEMIEHRGVTTMFMTTGLFHQMVESHLGRLRPLRQLLAGGDVLSPTHLRRAAEGLPATEVIAVYGPTEGTTFTTFHPVRAGDPEGPVPIGRPIANARTHVLDRSLLPAPVGVVGQLYIGGDGLARGYLARPDLTAERFVPDPVGGDFAEPGARLYATGDLARWRPDGVLEFLGRADHQVKLRGFRIELGEIETVLTSHPEVEAAVVVAREDLSGDKRLVAYVVPVQKDAPETLEIAELRSLVESQLPAYMVPAAFVTLSELPLTGNGKIDRRALPEPEARVRAELTPPRTPLEEEVAQVWCEVLGVDQVWVEDSFWDLGGHSLLATRALARLADTFGVEIPLQALFVAPTLGGFSQAVGQAVLSDLSDAELYAEVSR